ncbi:radical SAM protein [Candidatus Pacearchaeota archaeon]|nr:radical SAM protein [Candidatus Pacearchaeota archaeon]
MKKEENKKVKYISRNSLLYKSKVEYADFCINHVEGCAHGCTFPCYAFMMAKRFGKVKSYAEWIKPKIVKNSLELLDKEIPKYKDQIKFVHLCFTTDPFMHKYPEVADMTLKIINKLNSNGIKCTILTKGIYPRELLNTKKYSKDNEYGITLVSLDSDFKRIFESGSAPYMGRIRALKILHDAGLKTWVSMEPYPTPNISNGGGVQELIRILNEINFVDNIIFGKLNYNCKSSNFPESEEFYNRCANIVEKFCKINGIKYHIKYGTKKVDNVSTIKIFREKDSLCSFQTPSQREVLIV